MATKMVRVSESTSRQIDYLVERGYTTMVQVVTVAVDRLYRDEVQKERYMQQGGRVDSTPVVDLITVTRSQVVTTLSDDSIPLFDVLVYDEGYHALAGSYRYGPYHYSTLMTLDDAITTARRIIGSQLSFSQVISADTGYGHVAWDSARESETSDADPATEPEN